MTGMQQQISNLSFTVYLFANEINLIRLPIENTVPFVFVGALVKVKSVVCDLVNRATVLKWI
jgi:hypothetical protein